MLSNIINDIFEQIDKQQVSQEVKILAVAKNQPASAVQAVLDAGIRLIGENRVQEAVQKFPHLEHNVFEKHLIGTLQSNKENKALELFDVLQSIESLAQLQRLAKRLQQHQLSKKIYLQVNTSLEESKHGVRSEKEFFEMLDFVHEYKSVFQFQGLMTIGALSDNEKTIRRSFQQLRSLKDKVEQEYRIKNLELSMGMSNDFIYAVQEGATMIRIGTKLFVH